MSGTPGWLEPSLQLCPWKQSAASIQEADPRPPGKDKLLVSLRCPWSTEGKGEWASFTAQDGRFLKHTVPVLNPPRCSHSTNHHIHCIMEPLGKGFCFVKKKEKSQVICFHLLKCTFLLFLAGVMMSLSPVATPVL